MKKRVLCTLLAFLMLVALLPAFTGAATAESRRSGNADLHIDRDEKKQSDTRGATRGEITVDTPLVLGENVFVIENGGDTVYRPFTPETDGLYRIYSTLIDKEDPYNELMDTCGILKDAEGNQIKSNDDLGENYNFCLQAVLSAGVTYYVGVSFYDSNIDGSIPVTIKRFDSDYCGDNLKWAYDEKTTTLTITGKGDMWDFEYYGTPWDDFWDEMTTVVFPSGLTSIGDCAFVDFPHLTSFTIPSGVKRIGVGAFESCSGLETVSVPAAVSEINPYAFYYCISLRELNLTNGLTYIGYEAFGVCGALTLIRIPKTVKVIDEGAFTGCSALKDVILPNTELQVYNAAFFECEALADVYYMGTESERNENLIIDSRNELLLSATWHYVDPTYTVTFNPDGGSAVAKQTIEFFYPAKKPADPEKSGYIFKGWYLGNALYDFDTPVTGNITLKAKWDKIPAFSGTVELNPNDVQLNGKTPYRVYNGKAQKPGVIVKDKSGKTVAASKYTVTYRDNTNPGTAYVDIEMKDKSAFTSLWFKIYLPPTASTTVQNVQNGIQISWKKVSGAKGYVIYRRAWNLKDKGWTKFERWNNTKNTTWTDTKVYAGTRYQYGVKAYFSDAMDNYNLGIVGPLKTTVRITTRTLNSVTPGSKKLTVKWSGSSLFTGYQVQVATDKDFTKDLKTVTVSKAKTYQTAVSGLKKATTYYVRVRSYHVFEGTTYYGGWSNVLSGKTK